jgi:hypothetical protein
VSNLEYGKKLRAEGKARRAKKHGLKILGVGGVTDTKAIARMFAVAKKADAKHKRKMRRK